VVDDGARLPACASGSRHARDVGAAFGDPPATAAETRCRGARRVRASEAGRQIHEDSP
jgi:hypothetical protein